MPSHRSSLSLVVAFGFGLLVASARVDAQAPAPAPAAEAPVYRQLIDDAVREFSSGHWEEARALFKRAHEIEPNARTLRGMGMAAFELRMYVQSMRELNAALDDPRKPLDANMRASAQTLITKANAFVGRLQLVPNPATAKVLIDGRTPEPEADGRVLLDAGTHVISASNDGYKATSMRISIEGGADQVLQIPLEPFLAGFTPSIDGQTPPPPAETKPEPAQPPPPVTPPPPPPAKVERGPSMLPYAWITLVGAGVFGGAAAATWLIGDSSYQDVNDQCAPNCSDAEIDDSGVATTDTLTTVFLSVAIVSGAASAVLFAIAAGEDSEPEGTALQIGPGSVRIAGTF